MFDIKANEYFAPISITTVFYLKRKGIKQNAFFLNCIQRALEEADQAEGGAE